MPSRSISSCACTTAGTSATFNDRFNRRFDARGAGSGARCEYRWKTSGTGLDSRLMDMAHISDITLFRGGRAGSRHAACLLFAAGVARCVEHRLLLRSLGN